MKDRVIDIDGDYFTKEEAYIRILELFTQAGYIASPNHDTDLQMTADLLIADLLDRGLLSSRVERLHEYNKALNNIEDLLE